MDIPSKIIDFLLNVFLEAGIEDYLFIVANLLTYIGLSFVFKKCGAQGWKAFVPLVREVTLGKVADREKEGRVAAFLFALTSILYFVILFFLTPMDFNPENPGTALTLMSIVQLTVGIILLVFKIRMYAGLCEVYDRKKGWVVLWIMPTSFIPALMWGFMKKYQPLWTVEELESDAANIFSHSRATVLDEGLTVNLEERTATEFFEKKYLLRDIHMYIKPGHMVLLLGGSGAGKTTFINAVNGYEPAKAEIMLNGRNMYKNYKDMMYDIGFVPQADLMRGSDSVFRTLMDAAHLRLPAKMSKQARQERVEEVMEIFGLTPVRDNLVVKLSGGQRKRLSIAMEFISNPTLFILDEPDSGLDGVMARELFEQLRAIADEGKIIIVITHTPDRVIDLFDDVIVLAKDGKRTGRLAYFGPIEEAREFFGREKMEEIVKCINRTEEGGEGLADEYIMKYTEVQHA